MGRGASEFVLRSIELDLFDDVIAIFFQSSLYVNCAYVLRNAENI